MNTRIFVLKSQYKNVHNNYVLNAASIPMSKCLLTIVTRIKIEYLLKRDQI